MDVSRNFNILNHSYLMGNLSILKRLPKRFAKLHKELKNIKSKLPRGFLKKALNHKLFAKKTACFD